MFVIAIIAYNNDDRKTANVLFVCLHCILRRTNSFSCQWHLFFKSYKDLVGQGLVFYALYKTHFFFFFCINRLHIKILIAYRQKISTTAIIAIGVIGVVNNIPPTNKQVLPHNKYTYGFEMSFLNYKGSTSSLLPSSYRLKLIHCLPNLACISYKKLFSSLRTVKDYHNTKMDCSIPNLMYSS